MLNRLWGRLRRSGQRDQTRSVCSCTVEPVNPVTPMGLNEMPDAWETDQDMPVSLRPGDLRLERMVFGFDETRGAGRTLEYYDRAVSCGCPADCVQHPWRAASS